MSGLSERFIDDVMTFYAVTTKFDTGVATDADAVPAYRVYEEETTTPILNGNMALLDSANTAGLYSEQITLSAANGFEVGKSYAIHIAATVNSVAGATVKEFVMRKKPLSATTAANDLDVTATGAAGIDWSNVENATTAVNLSATNIDADQVVASVSGAVGSVTGAVGSVTSGVTVTTNNDKTGYALSAAGVTAIWAEVITGTTTAVQAMRGFIAAMLGKASGLPTAPKYRNIADTKNVIDAVTDTDGNRTSVTLDLT